MVGMKMKITDYLTTEKMSLEHKRSHIFNAFV